MWMERSKVNITIKTQKESSWKRWFFFATVSAPYLYDAAGAKCYDVEVMLKQTGEDNYVTDGSLKDTQYPYYLSYMYAGKKD